MRIVLKYAPKTDWMVSDFPMFAYRASLPIPPNLAVITEKRIVDGLLTEQEIIATMQEYQPGIVLIGRFKLPLVENDLAQRYKMIDDVSDNVHLYIRLDLIR
jgi:hypothetical protein